MGHANFTGEECSKRIWGGFGFHVSCPNSCIEFPHMFSWFVRVNVIQDLYRVIGCFHVCFACLSERKNLRGRLMLSTPSLLSWKKLGDDLNCWLAHYEPQKGMAFCQWKLQILGKVSSMFLLGRLMSIAKEKRWKTFQHIHDLGSAPVLHSSLANKLWRKLTGGAPHPKKMRNQGEACSCFLKVLVGLPLDLLVELGTEW